MYVHFAVRILGFDWDETNRRRHIALGFVPDGRFVLVVFEHDPETRWVRVVTAYEPTQSGWWHRYAKAKGLKP